MSPDQQSVSATEHRERLARALGGGYRLGELLARGGFGEVYRARDLKLERDLAVKTLRYELELQATTAVLERFAREARAMAKLQHPNIMPVYAVGEGEGLVYFTMPLVEGPSLRSVLDQSAPLPLSEVRRLLGEIGSALEHAHRRGVVHRDIKPENVLLAGEERRALVTDFGIAKALQGDGETITGSGVIIGTPHYMSPEQASGERTIDHRTDIYSLGVLAFQMLTGRLPFEAPSVQAVILKHLTEPAPPVARFRADCPPDLSSAVARCLAKDPEHRFSSAGALCQELGERAGSLRHSMKEWAVGVPGTDPVRSFRRLAVAYVALCLGLLAIDVVIGKGIQFAPVAAVLLVIPLLSRYSQLWMAGYSWRQVLALRPHGAEATPPATPSGRTTPSTPGMDAQRFGPYTSRVQRVRSERALVVGHVQRMARVEREAAGRALPAADAVLAESRALAEQLCRLDRAVTERSLRGTRADQLAAEALAHRDQLLGRLSDCECAIEELRVVLERSASRGVADMRAELDRAVQAAEAAIRESRG